MRHPTPLQGRLCVLAAAILWSLSGAFVKVLTESTPFGLGTPAVPGLLIAFYRTLFAGLVLVPFLRRGDISFRPLMLPMVISFAVMNALFVSALDLGTAANAIILQYTAPLWLYLAAVFWLKESTTRRDTIALVIAMTGVGVIVVDAVRQPTPETLQAVMIALGSGLAYAGVLLCLRLLRQASAQWLTVINHLFAALLLLPIIWVYTSPTMEQVVTMVLFGSVQMALPYWLVSRGLKVISPQEVGTITLLEPLLNPVWAYLVAGDTPARSTFLGGALILAALVCRYFPFPLIQPKRERANQD